MGVLVGTSLIVIIPEGIGAVYAVDAHGSGQTPRLRARDARLPWSVNAQLSPSTIDIVGRLSMDDIDNNPRLHTLAERDDKMDNVGRDNTQEHTGPRLGGAEAEHDVMPQHEHEHTKGSPEFYVGLSMISGFILMFLIDKIPRHASDNLQPLPPTRHISLNNLSQALQGQATDDQHEDSVGFLQSLAPSPKQTRSLATTTGLVIHAAADGIAMGASATASDMKLGFIVFVAIMIHKAPAAFGLTTVLLKHGLSKRAARGHLIIFSLAAPFGALSTWLLANLLGGGHHGRGASQWTGMLLLFSGGTFLYVTYHPGASGELG